MKTSTGRVRVLGDDISTDVIIPMEYLVLKTVENMKQYGFNPLRPELIRQIKEGGIIVANKNFGCGSLREQVPEVIKALDIRCVIAKSYAHIFFWNSINSRLLLIEQPDLRDTVSEGDEITAEVSHFVKYQGKKYPIIPLPENLADIVDAGGLVKVMRELNDLG